MTIDNQEELDLSEKIEEYLMNEENFGINPRIFSILDNVDSSEKEIAGIEKMIDLKIALRLRSMANSVFFGMQRRGKLTSFYDVITSLGMKPAKLFIIAMTLFSRLGGKHRQLEVESFAISQFARIIAEQMDLSPSAREDAEIGGLFLHLGKVAIAIYGTAKDIDFFPAFIERNHRKFAVKTIEKFALPEFLVEVITEDRLVLRKNSFSAKGVVYLSQALVEKIIHDFGIIEIKSPMPNIWDNLESTLGLKISEYFNLIGLGKYLKITSC